MFRNPFGNAGRFNQTNSGWGASPGGYFVQDPNTTGWGPPSYFNQREERQLNDDHHAFFPRKWETVNFGQFLQPPSGYTRSRVFGGNWANSPRNYVRRYW